MAAIIKTKEEIEILREGGTILASVLYEVARRIAPGISTKELDLYAEQLIKKGGDEPAFLNYKPEGAKYSYPCSLCTSINDEVVHGIPSKDRILKEGDIISIDCGVKHKGLFTDMAITVPVGKIDKKTEKLLNVTKEAIMVGIKAARGGGHVGDIGYAIEQFVKPHGYGIVKALSGHGVGKAVHEDPYIPNFGKKGTGEKLVPGMVLALEPMLNEGGEEVELLDDGYTFRTKDGSRNAHFEHTIVITEGEAEILTRQ